MLTYDEENRLKQMAYWARISNNKPKNDILITTEYGTTVEETISNSPDITRYTVRTGPFNDLTHPYALAECIQNLEDIMTEYTLLKLKEDHARSN
jgi:hypothetical protein